MWLQHWVPNSRWLQEMHVKVQVQLYGLDEFQLSVEVFVISLVSTLDVRPSYDPIRWKDLFRSSISISMYPLAHSLMTNRCNYPSIWTSWHKSSYVYFRIFFCPKDLFHVVWNGDGLHFPSKKTIRGQSIQKKIFSIS